MKKIPMLERFAAQSLVEYEGELIFSKEKFAELIVQECRDMFVVGSVSWNLLNEKLEHFGVEE